MTPHWVPPLMSQIVNETFAHYEDRLYAVFENDFIVSHPHYRGLPVHVRRREEESDGKWAGFVHITTEEDHETGQRMTDMDRCERIRYPRPSIDYCEECPSCSYTQCEKPLIWEEDWRNRTRVHILVRPERYLVILEPHPEKERPYCMLVTAYYLNYESSYNGQLRRYDRAKRAGKIIQ